MMEGKKQYSGILCFIISRKVRMQLKCKKKKNCAVYGGGAVTEQICQMWFVKFHVGSFPLDDAPRSGRPIAADSEHIKT